MAPRAVVRRLRDRGLQDDPARPRRRRHVHGLDVLVVDADIADMREREGDDLPGIGRIGEDFLIPSHGGVEADLAHRVAGRAEARAFEYRAIGKDEDRAWLRLGPSRFGVISAGMGRLFLAHQKPKSWCASALRALRLDPDSSAILREPIAVLRDEINTALKGAMKARDERRVSTLRLINAALKNADIEAQGRGKPVLSDEEILGLLQKLIKQRKEAIELYDKVGRAELAARERGEMEIIGAYLPKQMSEAEGKAAVADAIKATGASGIKDMGKVMAALKQGYSGRMDFAKASGWVKQLLAG